MQSRLRGQGERETRRQGDRERGGQGAEVRGDSLDVRGPEVVAKDEEMRTVDERLTTDRAKTGNNIVLDAGAGALEVRIGNSWDTTGQVLKRGATALHWGTDEVGTAYWILSGNRLYPSGSYGLAMRSGNVLHGTHDSTHVNFGIACTTGDPGHNDKYATVSGGLYNTARDWYATVGGGRRNTAGDWYSTVGGGQDNTASGTEATVGGGQNNTASGTEATVAGGDSNTAAGAYSFAAGRKVIVDATADNTFAFGYNFTTSTPNAVIFHNSVTPIKVGIGTTSPTGNLTIQGGGVNSLFFEYGGIYDAHMGISGYDLEIYSADDMRLKINEQNSAGVFEIIDVFNSNTLLKIENNGNVGIGTTSPGTHRLSVVGTAGLSTGTAWTNTSDHRWKNVQNELNGSSLDKILALRPVSYVWNDLHKRQFGANPGLKHGFIAQEVKEILPELISQDADGFYWYNPSGMEAILTAAIQEQQDIIEAQRSEIEDLKARMGRVEGQFNVSQ